MHYCIICKEIVKERFKVEVKDSHAGEGFIGDLCKFCFDRFGASSRNEGTFKLTRFMGWARGKKDRMRFY